MPIRGCVAARMIVFGPSSVGYGRGARRDIKNDATLKHIAAVRAMVNKGAHVWRYSHIGQPSLCQASIPGLTWWFICSSSIPPPTDGVELTKVRSSPLGVKVRLRSGPVQVGKVEDSTFQVQCLVRLAHSRGLEVGERALHHGFVLVLPSRFR